MSFNSIYLFKKNTLNTFFLFKTLINYIEEKNIKKCIIRGYREDIYFDSNLRQEDHYFFRELLYL